MRNRKLRIDPVRSFALLAFSLVAALLFFAEQASASCRNCTGPDMGSGGSTSTGGSGSTGGSSTGGNGTGGCGAEPGNGDTGAGSLIDNVMFEHHHFATDYETAPAERTSGCASCAAPPTEGHGTELPSLSLKRIHRPRVFYQHGAFGPGVFSNFDAQLVAEGTGASASVRLFTPENRVLEGISFTPNDPLTGQTTLGVLWPNEAQAYRFKSLTLTSPSGSPSSSVMEGGAAVVLLPDGSKWSFEIVRTRAANDGQLLGRLTRQEDRNGNALVISYRYPALTSDATLEYDRDRLWHISTVTDAYGRSMAFSYTLQGEWQSWGVSRVDLPNGQAIQYEYGNENILPLTHVRYPDGTVSTFEHGEDDVTQQHAVRYDDAGAEGTHRRKTVYFTRDQYVDPISGEVENLVPYLIRRAFNGSGELAYMNEEDETLDVPVLYAYMADQGYVRLTYDLSIDSFISEFSTN